MSLYYECKSVCVLAHIAELATVMQSVGTVQALYPSKISHSISSNATCHHGVHFHTDTVACKHIYQTQSSNYFLIFKINRHVHIFFLLLYDEKSFILWGKCVYSFSFYMDLTLSALLFSSFSWYFSSYE